MYELNVVTYLKESKEITNSRYEYEGQVISWNYTRRGSDIIGCYRAECDLGAKAVRETNFHKEGLEYLDSHREEYINAHSWRMSEEEIEQCRNGGYLRTSLTYYVKEVSLSKDGEIIKQEIYEYGV